MKKFILILPLFSLVLTKTVSAEEVNKFGIHILEPTDLPKAQELVNSSGGDWGWVTIVIRDDDMDYNKWQNFMNECRIRHLVPIVRIATHLEGSNWAKPKEEDASKWANFLEKLNWPTSDQYVIIFNEPNQAKEWGGEVNPKEYAKILSVFTQQIKLKSPKFKILNAGLDLAAPNSKTTMEAFKFIQLMNEEIPGIFNYLDGWASHSYPNHGFLGKPWEKGKTSIKGYEWELNCLKYSFGILGNLPVFITETGWPKSNTNCKTQGKSCFYNAKTVAEYIKYAFENVWLKDKKVKAVTPFVLNYTQELFEEFSWLDYKGEPYPQCEVVKSIKKLSWWPKQEKKYEILSLILPPFLPVNTKFNGKIVIKNAGQSILGEQGNTTIPVIFSQGLQVSNLIIKPDQKIMPGEVIALDFSITSTSNSGEYKFGWENLPEQKIKVLPTSFLSQAKYNFWQTIVLKLRSIL